MKTKDIKPKYTAGQKVILKKPELYGETKGEIISSERVYQEVYEDGTFDPDGLSTLESTISMCKLPYEFDGLTLKVHYPASVMKLTNGELRQNAKTSVSKLKKIAYTIKTAKMCLVVGENQFTVIP
jgi:hypothetical protein